MSRAYRARRKRYRYLRAAGQLPDGGRAFRAGVAEAARQAQKRLCAVSLDK